jgi:hypothetical protein
MISWAVHVAFMEEMKNTYTILVGNPERKSPLRRPRRKLEGNTKMYPKKIGFGCVDWVCLAQDRDQSQAPVKTEMKLQAP